jgi:outer membrane protein assembly factor BamB
MGLRRQGKFNNLEFLDNSANGQPKERVKHRRITMKRMYAISIATAAVILITCSVPEYDGEALWIKDLDDATNYDISLGINGEIYYTGRHRIVALDSYGNEKWSFGTDSLNPKTPSVGADGTLYFGSIWSNEDDSRHAGVLYALAPDHKLKWKKEFQGSVGTPLIGPHKTIYLISNSTLYAIDSSGNTLWSITEISDVHAIASDGSVYGSLWSPYNSIDIGCMVAVSPDGTIEWEAGIDHEVLSVAIDEDGTIYAEGRNSLHAINPDGSRKWDNPVQGGPVIGADGTIYVIGDENRLLALNGEGKTIWEYEVKNQEDNFYLNSPMIGADGAIYVGANKFYYDEDSTFRDSGFIYAFDGNGHVKWVYDIPQGASWYRRCLSDDGILYFISDNSGRLQLLALQTESMGLADSPWPCPGHDNQNTGHAHHHYTY